MEGEPTLLNYPYVLVRIRCDDCNRSGGYRLARLVEKFGVNYPLYEMLKDLTYPTCGRNPENRRGKGRYLDRKPCAARFYDLGSKREPDAPPGTMPKREPFTTYYERKPKRRTITLAEIRELHRWYDFYVHCLAPKCKHQAHVFGDKFDGSLGLDDLQDKFVCGKCGSKEVDLRIDFAEWGQNGRLRLVGNTP
ncbi:MAG TPA: hypothetical protein PL193_05345 [Xanthobacteraceae bacterium]|nr:hypothetical protein [Xanthobacteraceae bacterium]